MAIHKVSSLLDKHKKLTAPNDSVRESAIRVFRERVGLGTTKKDLRVSRGVLYVSASSVAKNKIFIHKEKILSAIRNLAGNNSLKDIR